MRTISAVVGSFEKVVEDCRVDWIQVQRLGAVQRGGYRAKEKIMLDI